jgi:glycosyltransferase involved in cell wall biosynthesis
MEPIRVLQLTQGLSIGTHSGGVESHIVKLVDLLDRSQFEPAVFSMWQYGGAMEEIWLNRLRQNGVSVWGMTPWKGFFFTEFEKLFRKLWAAVSYFKPHIIHSHSERTDWLNVVINRLHPLHPLAIRSIHIDKQWQTHPRIGWFLENYLFPRTFCMEIALSESIRDQLRKRRGRQLDRLSLCYSAIDEEFLEIPNVRPSRPHGVPANKPRIVIIGRLTAQKGYFDLLSALALVVHKIPAQLLIIGDGPLKPQILTRIADLKLQNMVHLLGVRRDVRDILSYADLFILPSYWEGFPAVILEAMSQKVPVIATDVSGSRELVVTGETGILVPPGQPDLLAASIQRLLEKPEESIKMGYQGREKAIQFTVQRMTRCHELIYQQIINRESIR